MKRIAFILPLILAAAACRADVLSFGLNVTNIDMYAGTLNGTAEVPPNSSTATGGEVGNGITYDTSTGLLDINVAYGLFGFQPLTGSYTMAHIHQGAAGVNGPIVIDLAPIHTAVGNNSGFFMGSVSLTPDLQTALLASDLYMNIHSSTFPGGEIRGQLIPTPTAVPEPASVALTGLGALGLLAFRRRSP